LPIASAMAGAPDALAASAGRRSEGARTAGTATQCT
jgi:hypothetical protein